MGYKKGQLILNNKLNIRVVDDMNLVCFNNHVTCHAITGPPGPVMAAAGGPPGPSMAAITGPGDRL